MVTPSGLDIVIPAGAGRFFLPLRSHEMVGLRSGGISLLASKLTHLATASKYYKSSSVT
jgi:hypothetical protein